jgi:NDP-sugar pyrophosphorylase family protein
MKAIIFPSIQLGDLAPLTDWLPEFLLPVANKPVVEHAIELLVRHDIKDILLVLRHLPFETENYFGNGSRWGATISYALPGHYLHFAEALRRITTQSPEPYVCFPAHMVTDLKVNRFIAAHYNGQGDFTLAMASDGEDGIRATDLQEFAGMQACPMILTPQALSACCKEEVGPDVLSMIKAVTGGGLKSNTYHGNFAFQSIGSRSDYLTVNQLVIQEKIPGIMIPGKERNRGIWIGHGSKIHPQAQLTPPVLIGQDCHIGKSILESGSVVGDHVIIDNDVIVRKSIVFKDTYLGSHLELNEMVVNKKYVLQVQNAVTVHIGDDIIIGDLKKKRIIPLGERLFQVIISILMLTVFSPVIAVLCVYHLIRPSRKILYFEKCCVAFKTLELSGEKTPREITLFKFSSKNRLIQKLPGLVNVLRGKLNLVGNSPWTFEQMKQLQADREELLFKAPVGLFSLWEAEGGGDMAWEEIMVQERYYAATRSFWGDIKILLKCLFPFLSHKREVGWHH